MYNCLQCGNGVKEEGESCDVDDFGRETCQSSQGTMWVALVVLYSQWCLYCTEGDKSDIYQTEVEVGYCVSVPHAGLLGG